MLRVALVCFALAALGSLCILGVALAQDAPPDASIDRDAAALQVLGPVGGALALLAALQNLGLLPTAKGSKGAMDEAAIRKVVADELDRREREGSQAAALNGIAEALKAVHAAVADRSRGREHS